MWFAVGCHFLLQRSVWRRGIRESLWRPLAGALLSHLPRELTASYYVEGHGNLFFLLNTQDSLCSHCLDWNSSYEGETISHTLGVRCLPHEGSPDGFKCVPEEAGNVQENKLCPLLLLCGAKGTVFLGSWLKKNSSGQSFRALAILVRSWGTAGLGSRKEAISGKELWTLKASLGVFVMLSPKSDSVSVMEWESVNHSLKLFQLPTLSKQLLIIYQIKLSHVKSSTEVEGPWTWYDLTKSTKCFWF